jgi:hypothetical protein
MQDARTDPSDGRHAEGERQVELPVEQPVRDVARQMLDDAGSDMSPLESQCRVSAGSITSSNDRKGAILTALPCS